MEWEKDDRVTKWVRHPCSVQTLSRMGNSTDVYIKFDNALFNATLAPYKKQNVHSCTHTQTSIHMYAHTEFMRRNI